MTLIAQVVGLYWILWNSWIGTDDYHSITNEIVKLADLRHPYDITSVYIYGQSDFKFHTTASTLNENGKSWKSVHKNVANVSNERYHSFYLIMFALRRAYLAWCGTSASVLNTKAWYPTCRCAWYFWLARIAKKGQTPIGFEPSAWSEVNCSISWAIQPHRNLTSRFGWHS